MTAPLPPLTARQGLAYGLLGLPLAFGGLLTVSAGVAVAHQLPERRMRLLFAVMLMATALWLLIKPYVVG